MAVADVMRVMCPSCGAGYRLSAAMAGRKARCTRCSEVFRVAARREEKPPEPGAPSEDDIMRWLMEGMEEDDHRPQEPRMVPPARAVVPAQRWLRGAVRATGRPDAAEPTPTDGPTAQPAIAGRLSPKTAGDPRGDRPTDHPSHAGVLRYRKTG